MKKEDTEKTDRMTEGEEMSKNRLRTEIREENRGTDRIQEEKSRGTV